MTIDKEFDYVQRHFSILNHLSLGAFVLKNDYTVLFWNKCLSDWSGVRAEDICGNDLRDTFAHFKKPAYQSRLSMIFSGGLPAVFSYQLHKHLIPSNLLNGKPRIQHINVNAVPSFDKTHHYALFVIEDVTMLSQRISDFKHMRDTAMEEINRRKAIENELKQQNRILQGILTATPVATALVENKKISWVNTAMMTLFGYQVETDYLGKKAHLFFPGEDLFNQFREQVLTDSQTTSLVETDTDFRKKNGTVFKGHIMASYVDSSEPLSSLIVTITDLTGRLVAEQDRLHKEKLQSILEMAGTICHEMNQPLMAISGYSELLLLKTDKLDPAYEKLNKIHENTKKAGAITRKLMGITKYSTKQYTKTEQIVDLDDTLPS